MNTTGKIPPLVAALLFLTGTTVVMGAVVAYNAGAVRVSVEEKKPGGQHVHLMVPAVAVPLALAFIPSDKLQQKAAELRPWLPAIRIASRELERTPDFVLVEVFDSDEHVRITKRGGSLFVDVNSAQEDVHVEVPLHMVRSVAEKLSDGLPPV